MVQDIICGRKCLGSKSLLTCCPAQQRNEWVAQVTTEHVTVEQVDEVSHSKTLLSVFQTKQTNTFSRDLRALLTARTLLSLS